MCCRKRVDESSASGSSLQKEAQVPGLIDGPAASVIWPMQSIAAFFIPPESLGFKVGSSASVKLSSPSVNGR